MGEKISRAKKNGNVPKNWSGGSVTKDSGGACKGCGIKYAKMTAGQFNRHLKAYNAGDDDCPDS
jgi:hypothetical protein